MNKDLILKEFSRVSEAMGWESYHSPKNLASALSVEAAKLLKNFQWLSDVESEMVDDPEQLREIAADLADLFIYANVLCHKLDLDPWTITKEKLLKNRETYVEKLLAHQRGVAGANDAMEVPTTCSQPVKAVWREPEAPKQDIRQEAMCSNGDIDWERVARRIAASREEVRHATEKHKSGKPRRA